MRPRLLVRSRKGPGRQQPAEPRVEGLRALLVQALGRRRPLLELAAAPEPTTALRVFHRAADGDPGLAIDAYDRFLVVHVFGERPPAFEQALCAVLPALGFTGAYVKRHPRQKNELVDARSAGVSPSEPLWGGAAPDELVVYEHGLPLRVRLHEGLRTGLFLDQRDNRQRVRALAAGKRVLNLFSYTGGFAVAALEGGAASVTCVDSAKTALARARENVRGLAELCGREGLATRHSVVCDDAFDVLRRLYKRGERFDLVVVDPPSYSSTRARRFQVRRDYAALAQACMAVLEPGGRLLACLNHHGTTEAELLSFLQSAASEQGRGLLDPRALPNGLDFPVGRGGHAELKAVLTGVG